MYGIQVVALAQNNTDKLLSAVEYVRASFYDADGKKLGDAFGRLQNVTPKSIRIFVLAGTDEVAKYSKVTFEIGSLTPGNPQISEVSIGTPTAYNDVNGTHVKVSVNNKDKASHNVSLITGFFDSQGSLKGVALGGKLDMPPGTADLVLDSDDVISGYTRVEVQLDSLL